MRRWAFGVIIALVTVLAAGCAGGDGGSLPNFSADGRLKVAVSFYPLYEFAREVGGDRVEVINLVPPGTEPHDWEPTAGHIKSLNAAQVFLYNGAGFEHWVDKTLGALDNKSLGAVEASKGFALLRSTEEEEGVDPHLWLDPQGAIHIVQTIRDAFVKADSANRTLYEANADAYIAKLKALDAELVGGLAACTRREFFTSHDAFGYLANRYGLTQHPLMGLAPDAEPKPKEMKAIVAEAKAQNAKYIFFETLVSDKVARVIAQEVGAQTLVLNPFEGLTDADVKAGKNYLSVMRENLANLQTALECGKS